MTLVLMQVSLPVVFYNASPSWHRAHMQTARRPCAHRPPLASSFVSQGENHPDVVLTSPGIGAPPTPHRRKTLADRYPQIRGEAPPRPGQCNTQITGGLEAVIMQCIASTPTQRFP